MSCAAFNCKNRSVNGFRLYRFPTDVQRRERWVQNCRRKNWVPTVNARLCHIHFESNQFETRRADGKMKLKCTAVPTIFHVPNPLKPAVSQKISIHKKHGGKNQLITASDDISNIPIMSTTCQSETKVETQAEENQRLHKENVELKAATSYLMKKLNEAESEITSLKKRLEEENAALKKKLDTQNTNLQKFLNDEQISALSAEKVHQWSTQSIIKGLKLRYSIGIKGYNYLVSTGYPIPSYSTLNRRTCVVVQRQGNLKNYFETSHLLCK